MQIPKTEELFDLDHTLAKELFLKCDTPYAVIGKIKDFCNALTEKELDGFIRISKNVIAARDAVIANTATIIGPAVIGHGAQIRPGAYIRGSAIIGDGAVIGNSTEIKNAIIFDGAALPHYNYVGDSIIGYKAHLGAGVILSNLRLDKQSVTIRDGEEKLDTGLRKFGALIGNFAEIGCNTVISPGSIVEERCLIYPLSHVNGIVRKR